jgi:sugar phosphate isomerase/epimerase
MGGIVYRELATGPIGVNVTYVEALRLAAENRFQAVSTSLANVEALGAERILDLYSEFGLIAGSCGLPVNFREDDATFEHDMSPLPSFCQAMSSVGVTRVLTWFMPWHATLNYEAYFEQLRKRTVRICQVLREHNMRFGLEFVGPETMRAGKPNPFIHDIDGLLELIEAVGADNLGFLLDAFHWYTSGGAPEDLRKLSDALIVGVHVNDAAAGRSREEQIDNQRALPGETGVIDIATFMQALDGMNYSGPVIVEPFSDRVRALPAEEAVRATAESLDTIWRTAGLD